MRCNSPSGPEPLLRSLETIAPLSAEQRQAVMELPLQIRKLAAHQDIVREGDVPSRCCLMLEGFACRYKIVGGRRQIFSFHIAGDIPDLQSLHLRVMDHSLGTLEPSKVAFILHRDLLLLFNRNPALADVFWRGTLIEAAVFREWMTGMGRRDAHTRVAHLLCEMFERVQAMGLAYGRTIRFPITQDELSDALGLSSVHINRVLQRLRSEGLITLQRGLLTVDDWDGLRRAGEFDPTYLHMQPEQVA